MTAPIGFIGVGTALPSVRRENDYWTGKLAPRSEKQRQTDVLAVERSAGGSTAALAPEIAASMGALGDDDLFRGAKVRYVLGEDEQVSDLEARAVDAAIADAGVDRSEIDLILVHSLLPDQLIPTNGPALQAKCRLPNAAAWSVDVGCASFQAQVAIAAALIQNGTVRCPLIVQSSSWSRYIDPSQPNSVGFGDAASAVILGPAPEGRGVVSHYALTDGSLRDGIVFAPIRDGQPQRRYWEASCAGPIQLSSFDVNIGKAAGQRATEFCREACSRALAKAGLTVADVGLFLCNQSTGWFVDACRRALEIPAERSVDTFAEIANVNEPALVYNLQVAERAGRLRDGDVILMYSPAAGFTRTAIVYRWWPRRR